VIGNEAAVLAADRSGRALGLLNPDGRLCGF